MRKKQQKILKKSIQYQAEQKEKIKHPVPITVQNIDTYTRASLY